MTDRWNLGERDEIAALLGMRDIPPLEERRRGHATALPTQRSPHGETRYCVLVVVTEDTDRALRRLRPLVARVDGIAFDLTVREATRRASDVAALA